ncbi:hypothetical protein GCM10009555_040120 [Acrocarpospora macrocephala]|uniref:Uncharacterized protein n=1 Tax=Acrocarpospora macrocephala TaxID=150177 RepID=A0A5M3WL79_9ACTN|nr:hypothetical protein Amac_036120 [Acrocarpospora macrocephala]
MASHGIRWAGLRHLMGRAVDPEESSVADNRLMSWVTNVMVSIHPDDRPNMEALREWLRTEAPLRDRPGRGCGFLCEIAAEDTAWVGGSTPSAMCGPVRSTMPT